MKRKTIYLKIFCVFLFALAFGVVKAQNVEVKGTVTTEKGEPVIGANVVVEGTTNGVATDLNGKFTLKVKDANVVLVVSSVGYNTEKVELNGKTELQIQLKESITNVDEVVVVGYGTQKKSLVTGAITKVDSKDLVKGSNLNATQALQGKTAGVVIMQNSGQPGSGVSVNIRGIGSNKNNDPLYILNGLPIGTDEINDLSVTDIESIEVLKDAASAAIYGSRGANGVVLITTKQGKKNEKLKVSYDVYYGQQNPWRKIPVLNSEEYMAVMDTAGIHTFPTSKLKFDAAAQDTLKRINTDWQSEMFHKNAQMVQHTLSFTGGTDKMTYSSAISYLNQQGIVSQNNSKFDRWTYRLNTSADLNVLTVGSNMDLAYTTYKNTSDNNLFSGSALVQALNDVPLVPVKWPDGRWGVPSAYLQPFKIGLQEICNPIAEMSYQNSMNKRFRLTGEVYGEFDFGKIAHFLNGLRYRASFSGGQSLENQRTFTQAYFLDANHNNRLSTINDQDLKYNKWNVSNVVTFSNTIGEHSLSLMVGQEAFDEVNTNITGYRDSSLFNDLDHAYLDNGNALSETNNGGFVEHRLASYFGRFGWSYGDKYMINATVRRDGSTRFGPNNIYATFPSVSGGWTISKEKFFPQIEALNLLKLRASWGQNGNENIGNFQYAALMSSDAYYYFGSGASQVQLGGVVPQFIPNPGLKWETSQQTDLAVDMAFFKNKVTLTLDLYDKRTKDWLVKAARIGVAGNNPPTINGGEVQNKGLEAELGFRTKANTVSFDIKLTGSVNKSKVLSINNSGQNYMMGGTGGFGQSNIIRIEAGQPMAYFYGYKTSIFQSQEEITNYKNSNGVAYQPTAKPGELKFIDVNGDGVIDDRDRTYLGSPTPDFIGGLNFSMEWKGLDFNMFWYTALGQQTWMGFRRFDQIYANYPKFISDNAWHGPGTSYRIPRLSFSIGRNNLPSSLYIYDSDYLRLKTISIGYTLPARFFSFAGISRFRIYIQSDNLLTFTNYPGYDPEIGGVAFPNPDDPNGNKIRGVDQGNYPQPRTFIAGLNLSF